MLINLGNDLWVRARNIMGFGPVALLLPKQQEAAECAVLVEWAGWVPCTREARDVMQECRQGGR